MSLIIEQCGSIRYGMVDLRISRGIGFTVARAPVDAIPEIRRRLPEFNLADLPDTKKAYLARVRSVLPELRYRDEVVGAVLETVISEYYEKENKDRQPTFDGGL